MMNRQFLRSVTLLATLGFLTSAQAMKIAVTDLTYAETVNQYFRDIDYHEKSSAKSQQSENNHDHGFNTSQSSHDSFNAKSQIDYTDSQGTYRYIEYGELHKFVGDIKGELIHSGFQVTQAKPYTAAKNEKIFDIIARIKKGYYPNADYVLFGTVSDLEFRDEANPIIGTNNVANTFSLMLVAEFSLINTKTYEVKSSFSASAEGQDVRLGSSNSRAIPSRGKIISDVSRNMGMEVAQQINFQLGNGDNYPSGDSEYNHAFPSQQPEGEIMHFSQ